MSGEAKTVSELCREALELRGKSLIKGRVRVDKDGDLVCDSFSSIPNSAHVLASSSGDYVLMEENAELFAFAANHIKKIAERCLELESQNKSQGMELAHLKIHGNCEHCEPIYGCCQSANGCGCYGWPTSFKATDKCHAGCATRLNAENQKLREAYQKAVDALKRIERTRTRNPLAIEYRKIARETLKELGELG